jgi:sugar fermentation stimulation protein A
MRPEIEIVPPMKTTLNFPRAPFTAEFQRRYKRFFADVLLEGQTVVAHVANTGSMKGCLHVGGAVLLSPAANPERKLRYSLEAIQTPWKTWIGVNTAWPNQLVKEVFHRGLNADWKQFTAFKSEHKISQETRLDGLLTRADGSQRFVEVKNVTLASGDCEGLQGVAQFPDAKTERGKKHLEELINLVGEGFEAEMVFVVQRTDCVRFKPAWEIDPDYAFTLAKAVDVGVKVSVWAVEISTDGLCVRVDQPLALDLEKPEGLLEKPIKKKTRKKA